jgi:hypothetical protein
MNPFSCSIFDAVVLYFLQLLPLLQEACQTQQTVSSTGFMCTSLAGRNHALLMPIFCRVLEQGGATGLPAVEKARQLGVVSVIVKRRMVYHLQHYHLGDGVEPGRVRAALPYLSAMPLWQEAGVCILREDPDIIAKELTVMYDLHGSF